MDKNIIEKLADLEHQQWCEWTSYMINNWTPENIKKWQTQIKTKYSDLTEVEKRSDRRWASKVMEVLEKILQS